MRVKELQELLSKFDPDLEVVCYSQDRISSSVQRGFVLFEVLDASKLEAERTRLDVETPYLKMGKSPTSVTIASLRSHIQILVGFPEAATRWPLLAL
jgi:DNA invertase Pin-like site-specific DNA recombinase